MKQILAILFLAIVMFATLFAQGQDDAEIEINDALPAADAAAQKSAWLLSIDEGMTKAEQEGKLLLLKFTGSDWCPPCMMMDKKVFSKVAFLDEVKKEYVMVKLDMPNSDPAMKKANEELMRQYKVMGVPMIIMMDSKGVEFKRFVASQHRTVKDFLLRLAKEKRRKDML